jgi:hypothetical protein
MLGDKSNSIGLTETRKQILGLTRNQRIWNLYLYIRNESLAMQVDLKDLLQEMAGIDKQLKEDDKIEVVKTEAKV